MYSNDGVTSLYTNLTRIPCDVYQLTCKGNKCKLRWKGKVDGVYRISQNSCFSEKLCWDYVDCVETMKSNFSAFTMLTSKTYRCLGDRPFVTSKTFARLFYSWSSHQSREFRKSCTWCGCEPKVLACDGTKIGILHHNMNIQPMEEADSEAEKVNIPNRRFDRCFIR